MAEDKSNTEGLNGEQPMQSLKDELPQVGGGAAEGPAPVAPASPRPASAATKSSPLLEQFRAFAKFGDSKADGKAISLSQSDKWMKQV